MTKEIAVTSFLFIVSLFLKEVLTYSHDPVQYHIQTDTGPDRFFRFQTYDGQYRKEKRFDDGTVVGTYGWVDPTGLLRLYDYIADTQGYRIARTRIMKIKLPQQTGNEILNSSEKFANKRQQHPLPASSNIRKVLPIYNFKNTETAAVVKDTTTVASTTTTISIREPIKVDESTTTPKPKFKPLFVNKRKQQNGQTENKFTRRRENYSSMRQQMKQQFQDKQVAVGNNEASSNNDEIAVKRVAPPLKPIRRQTTREKVFIPPVKSPSENNPTFLPSESDAIPDLGYDNPGGRVSIDYDLGNQYRKEKVFTDGMVVGEHGYVDPMGILRITYYKSGGPDGQQEFKKNFWVGSRNPRRQ